MDAPHCDSLELVRSALRMIDPRLRNRSIDASLSLIDDLGLDSIRIVDLTIALQYVLEADDLPMQEWLDREFKKAGPRFTVRSLANHCSNCIADQVGRQPDRVTKA
jgi:acyl carrier protein